MAGRHKAGPYKSFLTSTSLWANGARSATIYYLLPLKHILIKTRPVLRALDPQEIAALLRNGDVVVVKGSKKMFWVNKFVPRLLAALQAKA